MRGQEKRKKEKTTHTHTHTHTHQNKTTTKMEKEITACEMCFKTGLSVCIRGGKQLRLSFVAFATHKIIIVN